MQTVVRGLLFKKSSDFIVKLYDRKPRDFVDVSRFSDSVKDMSRLVLPAGNFEVVFGGEGREFGVWFGLVPE